MHLNNKYVCKEVFTSIGDSWFFLFDSICLVKKVPEGKNSNIRCHTTKSQLGMTIFFLQYMNQKVQWPRLLGC